MMVSYYKIYAIEFTLIKEKQPHFNIVGRFLIMTIISIWFKTLSKAEKERQFLNKSIQNKNNRDCTQIITSVLPGSLWPGLRSGHCFDFGTRKGYWLASPVVIACSNSPALHGQWSTLVLLFPRLTSVLMFEKWEFHLGLHHKLQVHGETLVHNCPSRLSIHSLSRTCFCFIAHRSWFSLWLEEIIGTFLQFPCPGPCNGHDFRGSPETEVHVHLGAPLSMFGLHLGKSKMACYVPKQ